MKSFLLADHHRPNSNVVELAGQQRVKMLSPRKWIKGAFSISTDQRKLDSEFILTAQAMAVRDQRQMALALSNSLCFGLYRNDRQIGFARVLSDFTHTALILDLYISPEYRFIGMGSWLLSCCLAHPAVRCCAQILQLNPEPAGFFCKNGFAPAVAATGFILHTNALH